MQLYYLYITLAGTSRSGGLSPQARTTTTASFTALDDGLQNLAGPCWLPESMMALLLRPLEPIKITTLRLRSEVGDADGGIFSHLAG